MKNLCTLLLLALLISCVDKKTSNLENDDVAKHSMDNIVSIPKWLEFEVAKTLPSDSLNVWIPTGNIETSTAIRVPRFPIQLSGENLKNSLFDLKRYKIELIDTNLELVITGVKNEQISAQMAVAAKQHIKNLHINISDFKSETGEVISKAHSNIRFAQYVPVQRARSELSWTGKPEEIYGLEVSGYGAPDVVADPLLELENVDVPAYRAQAVWFTFKIPKTTEAGLYKGTVSIQTDEFETKEISFNIKVVDVQIADAKDYKFFLELWLNPNAIAVANNLELWSEKHWKLIGKYMEDLVSRGAKTITTTINQDPWLLDWKNGIKRSQTGIGFAPMIQWNLTKEGSWFYDYSVFDRYVELALEKDLKERIDVFSLTPFEWERKENKVYRNIVYFDESSRSFINKSYRQFDVEYKEHWKRFLKDFEIHLRRKGWFKKTYLSFDESPKEVIEFIVETVSKSAPDFLNRFSIAGKPIVSELAQSLSIFYEHFIPEYNKEKPVEELLTERSVANKTTTLYLCGAPAHPNTFSFSPAIESQLIPWLALKMNTDGYLRWAYNSWPNANPYKNPVFNYIQGDAYYVYPGKNGPVSSIRWELLKEGIEDYELYRIIKEEDNVSEKNLQKIIELATRNIDGRHKDVDDFIKARKLMLEL